METDTIIDNVVKLIHMNKDRNIYVIGSGFAIYAVDYFIQKLIIFGYRPIRPMHYEDFDNEFDTPGLIIALSESGTAYGIVGTVEKAISHQFYSVAITADKDSPLANLSHFCIPIKSTKTHHTEYKPNLYIAKTLIMFELILTKLSALL